MEWLSAHHNDAGLKEVAVLMEKAVFQTMEEGTKTRDLNGSASTTEFTAAIVANVSNL